jgi:hypothetical protein
MDLRNFFTFDSADGVTFQPFVLGKMKAHQLPSPGACARTLYRSLRQCQAENCRGLLNNVTGTLWHNAAAIVLTAKSVLRLGKSETIDN